jgi:hypothetical protein
MSAAVDPSYGGTADEASPANVPPDSPAAKPMSAKTGVVAHLESLYRLRKWP